MPAPLHQTLDLSWGPVLVRRGLTTPHLLTSHSASDLCGPPHVAFTAASPARKEPGTDAGGVGFGRNTANCQVAAAVYTVCALWVYCNRRHGHKYPGADPGASPPAAHVTDYACECWAASFTLNNTILRKVSHGMRRALTNVPIGTASHRLCATSYGCTALCRMSLLQLSLMLTASHAGCAVLRRTSLLKPADNARPINARFHDHFTLTNVVYIKAPLRATGILVKISLMAVQAPPTQLWVAPPPISPGCVVGPWIGATVLRVPRLKHAHERKRFTAVAARIIARGQIITPPPQKKKMHPNFFFP